MSEELYLRCHHKANHHAKGSPSCLEQLSTNPNIWCSCDETQETIRLQSQLDLVTAERNRMETQLEKMRDKLIRHLGAHGSLLAREMLEDLGECEIDIQEALAKLEGG